MKPRFFQDLSNQSQNQTKFVAYIYLPKSYRSFITISFHFLYFICYLGLLAHRVLFYFKLLYSYLNSKLRNYDCNSLVL
jgi:hypothetical protein